MLLLNSRIMLLLNFNSQSVPVGQKTFLQQVLNDEETADMKTALEKKGNILRKSSSCVWESVRVHAQIHAKKQNVQLCPSQAQLSSKLQRVIF